MCGAEGSGRQQAASPVGIRAFDLDLEGGPSEQLGDRALANHLAPVDDGDGITGAFDLVEQMRRQHDGPTLGDQGPDHVADVEHPGRVEAVHGLIENQQLGVPEEAGGHAKALAHAHGVLRHLVVRRWSMSTRSRAGVIRPLAAGSRAAARICRFWRPVR